MVDHFHKDRTHFNRVCFKRVTLNLAKVTDDAVEEMLSR